MCVGRGREGEWGERVSGERGREGEWGEEG